MILRFFSGSQPIGLLLIPLLAAVLWLPAFWGSNVELVAASPMPLFAWLTQLLGGLAWLTTLISLLLVVAQAFFLNSLVNDLHFLEKRSNLPAFCFVLYHAVFPEQLQFSPAVICNTFLLLAAFRMYAVPSSSRPGSNVFDTGLLIGLAGLFYAPAFLLVPIAWVVLNEFRPFNPREWLLPVLGAALPLLFCWSYLFWFDRAAELSTALSSGFSLAGNGWLGTGWAFFALLGYTALAILLSLPAMVRALRLNIVAVRKSLQTLIWLLILAVAISAVAPVKSVHLLSFGAIPLSIWLAQALQQAKRKGLAELLIAGWVGLIFFNHFG